MLVRYILAVNRSVFVRFRPSFHKSSMCLVTLIVPILSRAERGPERVAEVSEPANNTVCHHDSDDCCEAHYYSDAHRIVPCVRCIVSSIYIVRFKLAEGKESRDYFLCPITSCARWLYAAMYRDGLITRWWWGGVLCPIGGYARYIEWSDKFVGVRYAQGAQANPDPNQSPPPKTIYYHSNKKPEPPITTTLSLLSSLTFIEKSETTFLSFLQSFLSTLK